MNIYTRLKQDHEKQRDLCEDLKKSRSGSQNRADLWDALKVELEAHAAAEEQVFYSALMKKPHGTEEARHSVHEHQEMTKLITELDAMDQTSDIWEKKYYTNRRDLSSAIFFVCGVAKEKRPSSQNISVIFMVSESMAM